MAFNSKGIIGFRGSKGCIGHVFIRPCLVYVDGICVVKYQNCGSSK